MFNHTYNPNRVTQTEGFAPITPGEYQVEIAQVTEKISRKTGANMLELKLKITAAMDAANQKFVGRQLFYYLIEDDQYLDDKLNGLFKSCGREVPPVINNGAVFVGLLGKVKTKLEAYNGEQRASVVYWIRPKPGETPPPPAAEPKNSADDIPF